MKTCIIVAYDEKRVIGYKGKILWNLPEDLKLFMKTTLYCPIIMGRKTWESLKTRPLTRRLNIVISRQQLKPINNMTQCSSIEESITEAKKRIPNKNIYIIGGEQIYQQSLEKDLVDEVIATEVYGEHKGDAFFPALSGKWTSKSLKSMPEFNIVEYKKVDSLDIS